MAHLSPIAFALADGAADAESDDGERDKADREADFEALFGGDGVWDGVSGEGVRVQGEVYDGACGAVVGAVVWGGDEGEGQVGG